MPREWIDAEGVVWEIVWDGSMKIPVTQARPSNPNPVWDTPDRVVRGKEKRLYNKTGNHAKTPGFWDKPVPKVEYDE